MALLWCPAAPLILEPFRYYQYGERTVHLDGCVEVEAAYYSAPPGWIGRKVHVQRDGRFVRLLDPKNGQLLREHLRGERGRHRIKEEDRPQRTPMGVVQLLARTASAGEHIGQFCKLMHSRQGEPAVRRMQGILSFTKKYGIARVDYACAAAREMEAIDFRFVRRYLERNTQPPISLRQVDPLMVSGLPVRACFASIRQLNLYRDLQHAFRQLRLGSMARTLETRLRQAQAEPMAPVDLISVLISDEMTTRADRLLERRRKMASFRDPHRSLDNFDFAFNPKINRSLIFDLATGGFIANMKTLCFSGRGGTGKSHLAQAIGLCRKFSRIRPMPSV